MKRKLIGLATMYVALTVMLLGQPAGRDGLIGVWAVKIVRSGEVLQSPLPGIAIFGEDGGCTAITGNAIPVLPPALQAIAGGLGIGHGRWTRISDKRCRLTCYSPLLNGGVVSGFQRNQSTMVLSETGNDWTAQARLDVMDASSKVVFGVAGELTGKRLETPASGEHPTSESPFVGVRSLTMFQTGQRLPPVSGLAAFNQDGSFFTTGGNPVKKRNEPGASSRCGHVN